MQRRYDRLRAINAFGYNIKWDALLGKSVTIAGVGGLGMLSAEMLARCGVGILNLFDMDTVDDVNLNRLGFHPDDLGKPKVEVISERIKRINRDVHPEPHHGDIMMLDNEDVFEDRVSKSNVVLMGMDNLPARMFVNQKCVNNGIVLIDGGASRSALSGYVQPIIPGKTACTSCRSSIAAKAPRERGQRCTASLPTTMAIIASIQVQEALKYLLGFGTLISYVTCNALTGEFTSHQTRPDPACPACKHVQRGSE